MFPIDDSSAFTGSNYRVSFDGGKTYQDADFDLDFASSPTVAAADTWLPNVVVPGGRVPADPGDLRRGLARAAQHDKRVPIDRCPSDVMDEALAACKELGAELEIEDKVDDEGSLATRAVLITRRGRAQAWIDPAAMRPWRAAFKKLGLIE